MQNFWRTPHLISLTAVPLLARAKIIRIERDFFRLELEVVPLPRDGLDENRGVETTSGEPTGWLRGEPHPRFTEFDRIGPCRSQVRRGSIVLGPGESCRFDAGARTDGIERHVVIFRFKRQCFDEPFDSVLDRAVRDLLFIAADTGAACDADDVASALGFHLIPNGVRAIEHSAYADIYLPSPLLRSGRFKSNYRYVSRVMHHDN